MLEKEIKILDIDQEKTIQILEKLGAKKTFEGYIHDIYYDFEEGENQKMEQNKRLFRVRKKGDLHLYTIKRKRNKKSEGAEKGIKIADEAEYEITDVESFSSVLEKYGMRKIREKKKFRISYKLGEVEFDIDKYDEIPTLIEIEAKSKEEIKYFISVLGFDNHTVKKFGSRKLYKYYNKEYLYIK
ncbi:CYTH domain-containing protein [Candidatus Gracilibacteria bacterium]|nr:CYTH domain-containing protein [Candidatus Gracilibacteria bacterium]